jgi:hypothetical protein
VGRPPTDKWRKVQETAVKRFFVQQLDTSAPALPNGGKTWDYVDSFEEALEASDLVMAEFTPDERSKVVQEITDIEAVNATWTRRGYEPWSLGDPLR